MELCQIAQFRSDTELKYQRIGKSGEFGIHFRDNLEVEGTRNGNWLNINRIDEEEKEKSQMMLKFAQRC